MAPGNTITDKDELSPAMFSKDLEEKQIIPLQELLEQSIREHHDCQAICTESLTLTYAEVEARANQIAQAIDECKLPDGSTIGIYCEDRPWLICTILGILQSRMVFVIIETSLPKPRVTSMLTQLDMKYIITDQSPVRRQGIETYTGSYAWLSIAEISVKDGQPGKRKDHQGEDQVYVYFTSGSTGRPKGVVGINRSIAQFVRWEIDTFNLDASFRFSQFTNPSFDAFMRDVFVPLCVGGAICIPGQDTLSSGKALAAWMVGQEINLVHCVPSIFKLFKDEAGTIGLEKNLKYVLMAGEKILPFELKSWYERHNDQIQLVNLYGLTETTMIKAYHIIGADDANKSYIPIKAMKGAQLLVLDEDMNICPLGTTGEIYIRTPYTTAGYLAPGKLDTSLFVPNPFSGDANDLICKTGDLGKRYDDGNIEILGRIDQQIKIRGLRIEPDDIKENILKYPAVSDALITTKEDAEGDEFICAYVITDQTDLSALQGYLADNLPAYMIPSFLVSLSKFPLLPNGKVDMNLLPGPCQEIEITHTEPTNDIEFQLVELVSETFKIDKTQISTTSNVLELGRNSLKLMTFINKMIKKFDVPVKIQDVIVKGTIQNLADYLITARQVDTQTTNGDEFIEISI